MGAFHTHSKHFYEVVPCKFCGDDARRVVCSLQSCSHALCVKERGICLDCAAEKMGAFPLGSPVLTIHEYQRDDDREALSFDNAIRLIEDMG